MTDQIARLFRGEIDQCGVGSVLPQVTESGPILFPGAFNPLHDGHRKMADLATERCGQPICYELSIVNVDKPPLAEAEIRRRLTQFGAATVLVTRAATFVEKARLFPRAQFVVGADTAMRLGDERFYTSRDARDEAISALSEKGCRFLVFGRMINQAFLSGATIPIREDVAKICQFFSEDEFRMDVSSSQLRGETAGR